MNPLFGRRSWVKLWVNEWLDGTTRFEMSDAQRAFWIDLLAMAGRSRYPGVVCAGKSPEGNFVGYPLNKYQSLMSEPIEVEETLALFARTGKIRIEVTSAAPIRLLSIELLNWTKYQSEYQRQKPYRHRGLQQGDSQSDNQSNKTEVEVEVEGEVEGDKGNPSASASPPQVAQPPATLPVEETAKAESKPPANPALLEAKEYAFKDFERIHGQPPTWDASDYAALAKLFHQPRTPKLTSLEFHRRWLNFSSSTDHHEAKQNLRLRYFCGNFDRFMNGPIHGGNNGNNGNGSTKRPGAVAGQPGKYVKPSPAPL